MLNVVLFAVIFGLVALVKFSYRISVKKLVVCCKDVCLRFKTDNDWRKNLRYHIRKALKDDLFVIETVKSLVFTAIIFIFMCIVCNVSIFETAVINSFGSTDCFESLISTIMETIFTGLFAIGFLSRFRRIRKMVKEFFKSKLGLSSLLFGLATLVFSIMLLVVIQLAGIPVSYIFTNAPCTLCLISKIIEFGTMCSWIVFFSVIICVFTKALINQDFRKVINKKFNEYYKKILKTLKKYRIHKEVLKLFA